MISDVAIVTRDRPALLARALASALHGTDRLTRTLRVHVFDDAQEPKAVEANHRVVKAFRDRSGVAASHVTREHRVRWADALVRESAGIIEAEVARLALVGAAGDETTTGANRNAVMLSMLDRAILCIDDDVGLPVAPMLGCRPGVRVEPKRDPTEFHFFATHELAMAALSPCDKGLVEVHETLLGQTHAVSAGGAAPAAKGHVAITMAGVAGDSGMGGPLYYALLEGQSRQRWVADYEALRTTREVVRGATVATVSGSHFLMGANLGLDLASFLPPFVPLGRNQDGPVALALRHVAPESYIGHVPYVVTHTPPGTRVGTFAQAVAAVEAPLSSHVLTMCMGVLPRLAHQTDSAARAARLGRFLLELTAEAGAFHRVVRNEAIRAQEVRLTRLEDALASRTSEPDDWARDLRQLLRAGEAAMSRPDYPLVSDLGGDPVHRKESLRERVRSYGLVLAQWPALRAAASELERKGKGLLR